MKAIIEVSELRKSYSDLTVLKGIDLSIYKGEVFGLLGENGSGKSTMIECILGTRKRDKGNVLILGMSPHKDRRKLFQNVGVQFQEANYPEKIRVNELCQETSCLYKNPADFKGLLREFSLGDKGKSFVSDLSGGQKQKLFIILALIPNPQVVFLDELTTGLDTKARREVWKSLLELKKKGMTILLTSHFMDEVEELCDRVGILKDGKFLFYGTVQEAVKDSPYEVFEDAYLWYTKEEDNKNE